MSATASERLNGLSGSFRTRYPTYEELTTQLKAWAASFPNLAHMESLATTPEGRELWLLTLGPDPDRTRPSVWVDGNMHASELCGSSVALAIAEDVLRLHLDEGGPLHGLAPQVREALREVRFYILPRISPDGAEAVLESGRYVRSVPRDERPHRAHARWVGVDLDGDGQALVMRKADATGEYVEHPDVAGLLVPRELGDPGPYYKLYPEGVIENFDGVHVPTPGFLSDNEPDLNRNFPWHWVPEPDQEGAGDYPGSALESRAIVEFASRHPEIFAWLNLHTFGGVFIRPRGDAPDTKMDPEDLALYKQIGKWGEDLTGYPMVSGFEQFTYEPDKPIHGDLVEWAYAHRGCISYVCELWDIFDQLGLERPDRFVDRYTQLDRNDLARLADWDQEHNEGRIFKPWKPVDHPQLGEVEVGGIDPRVGLSNPPYEKLAGICESQSAMWLRVAALSPRVVVADVAERTLGEGLFRLDVEVENRGYLPTNILSSATSLPFNEPLWAELRTEGSCELVSPEEARRQVGHLDGWGRGRHGGSAAIYFVRSRGNTGTGMLHWTLRGSGEVVLRVGSCRVGWTETRISVG